MNDEQKRFTPPISLEARVEFICIDCDEVLATMRRSEKMRDVQDLATAHQKVTGHLNYGLRAK